MILRRERGSEQLRSRHVKRTFTDSFEQQRNRACGARDGDPAKRRRLRKVQHLGQVTEHRATALLEIEQAPIDLCKIGEQIRLVLAALRHESVEVSEQFAVRGSLERILHGCLSSGPRRGDARKVARRISVSEDPLPGAIERVRDLGIRTRSNDLQRGPGVPRDEAQVRNSVGLVRLLKTCQGSPDLFHKKVCARNRSRDLLGSLQRLDLRCCANA